MGGNSGLILPNFKVVQARANLYDHEFHQVCYGQDFGYNHANVILKVGFKENLVYVIDEIYTRFKDTEEIIKIADSRKLRKDLVMYCDSAEPDRINTWRKHGYRALAVKKEVNSIKSQINFLRCQKIFISSSCINLISEITNWKYQFDPISNAYLDSPQFGNDDCIAALRYSIESIRKGRNYLF